MFTNDKRETNLELGVLFIHPPPPQKSVILIYDVILLKFVTKHLHMFINNN